MTKLLVMLVRYSPNLWTSLSHVKPGETFRSLELVQSALVKLFGTNQFFSPKNIMVTCLIPPEELVLKLIIAARDTLKSCLYQWSDRRSWCRISPYGMCRLSQVNLDVCQTSSRVGGHHRQCRCPWNRLACKFGWLTKNIPSTPALSMP